MGFYRRHIQAFNAFSVLFTVILVFIIGWQVMFQYPVGVDEESYLFQARVFDEGKLRLERPPDIVIKYSDYARGNYLLNEQGVMSKYPPGHLLTLMSFALIGDPWYATIMLTLVTLIGAYKITTKLYGVTESSMVLCLFMASPVFLLTQATLLSHTSTLMYLALYTLYLINSTSVKRLRDPVYAGFFLGLAFITRPGTAITYFAGTLIPITITIVEWFRR